MPTGELITSTLRPALPTVFPISINCNSILLHCLGQKPGSHLEASCSFAFQIPSISKPYWLHLQSTSGLGFLLASSTQPLCPMVIISALDCHTSLSAPSLLSSTVDRAPVLSTSCRKKSQCPQNDPQRYMRSPTLALLSLCPYLLLSSPLAHSTPDSIVFCNQRKWAPASRPLHHCSFSLGRAPSRRPHGSFVSTVGTSLVTSIQW